MMNHSVGLWGKIQFKDYLIISILTLIGYFVLSQFIDLPFTRGYDGAGGCLWGSIARNYLRYGFLTTKFGMVDNAGPLLPTEFRYYTHHPPLTTIIIALGFKLLGIHEWVVRFIYILFALGFLVLFYFFALEIWNRSVACLACITVLIMPMYLHFSSVPDMISITLFFSLLCMYAYARWVKTNSISALVTMSIGFILAAFCSWEAYYLVPAILYHNFVTGKRKEINLTVSILGISAFLSYLTHVLFLVGIIGFLRNVRAALFRTGVIDLIQDPSFVFTYVKQIAVWIWFLFTPIVVMFSILFFIYFVFSKNKPEPKTSQWIKTLFIFGALKLVIFQSICYHHPQFLYYLIPFMALTASLSVCFFFEQIRPVVFKWTFSVFVSISLIGTVFFITKPVFLSLKTNDYSRTYSLRSEKFDVGELKEMTLLNALKAYTSKEIGAKGVIFTNIWHPQFRFYLDVNTKEQITDIKWLQEALSDPALKGKKRIFIFHDIGDKHQTELLRYLKKHFPSDESFIEHNIFIFDLNRSSLQSFNHLK